MHPDNKALRLSPKGLLLIARFEGYRRFPYNDPWNATIGYGHLLHLGKVTWKDRALYPLGLSEPQARRLLAKDAVRAEAAVHTDVTVKLNQHEYDALVSFVLNIGSGGFRHSTTLDRLNSGDRHTAADALLYWTHGNGGVQMPGLLVRRKDEREVFLYGLYPG